MLLPILNCNSHYIPWLCGEREYCRTGGKYNNTFQWLAALTPNPIEGREARHKDRGER